MDDMDNTPGNLIIYGLFHRVEFSLDSRGLMVRTAEMPDLPAGRGYHIYAEDVPALREFLNANVDAPMDNPYFLRNVTDEDANERWRSQ